MIATSTLLRFIPAATCRITLRFLSPIPRRNSFSSRVVIPFSLVGGVGDRQGLEPVHDGG
nr:MAG TPA: hypothetical protein [Caudoviricetes sp.]